jgi:hypothetical protein
MQLIKKKKIVSKQTDDNQPIETKRNEPSWRRRNTPPLQQSNDTNHGLRRFRQQQQELHKH